MLSVDAGPRLGTVETIVTSGRGLNPEELTRRVIGKVLYVSPALTGADKLKAEAQYARLEVLLQQAFAQAQKSQNTTIYNRLMDAGETIAAGIVKEL